MHTPFSRRDVLLRHNAGQWEGCFIRLDGTGAELERFESNLSVADQNGTIKAALTNRLSGQVRSMEFDEPPAEMQITPEGHWSLGPDRIGPWPWVSELCLVCGEQRRRAVIRHNSGGLESLVVVIEGRPELANQQLAIPAAPLQLIAGFSGPSQTFNCHSSAELGLKVISMANRTTSRGGQQEENQAERVELHWKPCDGIKLMVTRSYGTNGLLTSPFDPLFAQS
jgi:hypothetical protein